MVIQTKIVSEDASGLGWVGGAVARCEFLVCFGRVSRKYSLDPLGGEPPSPAGPAMLALGFFGEVQSR